MRIRSPAEIGGLIRDQRTKLGLDQKSLAEKVGATRQWLAAAERGKPRTEIGLILRTLNILGIRLNAEIDTSGKGKVRSALTINIAAIVDNARETRK